MLRSNKERLVMVSVMGQVSAPGVRAPYRVGYDGVARVGPGTGGITYNVRVGDPALGWAGDHVEPGVSSKDSDEAANGGYNTLACVGNRAYVVGGEAKGATGVVTGKHGGIEHVLIDFPPEVLEKMAIGDKIQVRAYGQGLELLDFPGVRPMNLDPGLFDRMGVEGAGGKLRVPVAGIVPPELMGSGLGSQTAERGDYDITTQDKAALKEAGLDKVRLGDIVAIRDHSSFYGRSYQRGAVIIGVVVHCDSNISGHGPGVTSLLTGKDGSVEPVIVPEANIARYLGLRG
ncbi:MAG: DUF4438 domain-containing protein [Bacillota bacterium]